MTYKNFGRGIFIRVLFLFVALVAASWLLVNLHYLFFAIAFSLVAYLTYELFRFNKKAKEEIEQFVESIHYRDFSRYFDMKHAPVELQPFRKGFNEINSTFKVIIREKETQHQYMQKILELVDTGIICYEEEEGEIILINESLKNLLGIPYLIYGPYAYTNTNGTGAIKRMQSSYVMSSNTTRVNGPAVGGMYPNGCFLEDFNYVAGSGDLDERNGRFCVTPEYPAGIYCYFVTIDASLNPVFPYTFYGTYYGVVHRQAIQDQVQVML